MNTDNTQTKDKNTEPIQHPFSQTFFHGTKADLKIGDFLEVGFNSNFVDRKLKHIYFSSTLNAAVWGAELSTGSGHGRIYLVEVTGPFEDDPNLTNKKFPGNPTMSYRSTQPLKIVGEVTVWQGHTAEQIKVMKDGVAKLAAEGGGEIEE